MLRHLVVAAAAAATAAFSASTPAAVVEPTSPLHPVALWPLPTSFGIFNHSDHLLLDEGAGVLYASAKNIDVVFVLNASDGTVLHALSVHAPQGLALTQAPSGQWAGRRLLWVGSDGDGLLSAFDTASLALTFTANFSRAPSVGEVDDLQVDPVSQQLLLSAGDDGPASTDPAVLATLDSATGGVIASVPLPAHLEAFRVVPGATTLIGNVPDALPSPLVVVVDRAAGGALVRSWPLPTGCAGNVPMAYDAVRQHLMLGLHTPPSVLVVDVAQPGWPTLFSGPAPADLDDMWFDAAAGLLFASGGGAGPGDGSVAAWTTPVGPGNTTYSYAGTVSPGGKNSFVDVRNRRLYVTVPATLASEPATIQVYAY